MQGKALELRDTEVHREPAILEELQDTETQYNREPEPFLEQAEQRDTGRRAPEAALP